METVQNVVKGKKKEIQGSMIEDNDWRKKLKSIHIDELCNKVVTFFFFFLTESEACLCQLSSPY